VLGFVSLWCSAGHEGQRYSRAEGKGTADDNEKHDTYKSISDAAAPAPDHLFSRVVKGYQVMQEAEIRPLTILTPIYSQTIRVIKDKCTKRAANRRLPSRTVWLQR
jgi:hypothetical protein